MDKAINMWHRSCLYDMRVELFERGIVLSSEREKLGKGYWVFVIFFARIFN